MSANDKLRNVGPKSAAWLRQVGVRTQQDLETLGSVAAFIKVKRAGFRPSLNLLYALEGALLGCHWQQVPEERRAEMLAAAETASLSLPLPKNKRVVPGGEVRDVTPAGSGDGADSSEGGYGHDAADGEPAEMSFGFDDPASDAGGGASDEH
jgi:DNA transformation protein and related proteins